MTSNRRWLFLFLVVVIAAFLQWRSGGFYGEDKRPVYQEVRLKTKAGCDVAHAPCVARDGDISLTLKFAKQPDALAVFPVQVEMKGVTQGHPGKLLLIFEMAGMDMGQVRQVLKWNKANQRWQGQSILPVCSTGRKGWKAKLELISGNAIYLADFSFTVQ